MVMDSNMDEDSIFGEKVVGSVHYFYGVDFVTLLIAIFLIVIPPLYWWAYQFQQRPEIRARIERTLQERHRATNDA